MCKYARKVHIRGVGQGHIFIALLILVEKKKAGYVTIRLWYMEFKHELE